MPIQHRNESDTPITNQEQLVRFLADGARREPLWGIGAEMEKLVLDARTGEAAEFSRIELLLAELAETGEWQQLREGDRLVGLRGPDSSITLEPGGQLELSGQLCDDLFCNFKDFSRHIEHAVAAAERLGLVLLGLGTQPFSRLDEIEWTPKARYGIMGPYMQKTGDMGRRMMKQTAGLQVNLDFRDEADCMRKMRLGQALTPLLYALFANSPLIDGQPSGFLTTRGEIWSRTDRDRTGLLQFLDDPAAGFEDYVAYALDVPMYFIVRSGRYIDLTRHPFSFRQFLDSGHAGHRATLADWNLHLSTLFPEVRLRPQIEVRAADSLPPRLVMTVAALLKGLMYDEEAFNSASDLFLPASCGEIGESCRQAWRLGLNTPWRGETLQILAGHCLTLARAGLDRQKHRRCQERSESSFLDGLDSLIEGGVTLAEQLLENWHGTRRQKLALLIQHCGFTDPALLRADHGCPKAQTRTVS